MNRTVLSYGQTFSYENWCSFILQPYYFQKMCIWNDISVEFVGQYLISYHILLTFYTSLVLIQLYSVLSRTIKADVYDRSLPHASKWFTSRSLYKFTFCRVMHILFVALMKREEHVLCRLKKCEFTIIHIQPTEHKRENRWLRIFQLMKFCILHHINRKKWIS